MAGDHEHHTLSGVDFDTLAAGYETPDAAAVLDAAVFSYRQYELQGILELDHQVGHQTARVNFSDRIAIVAALSQVGSRKPALYSELLTHPSVGMWMAHVRRQNEAYTRYRDEAYTRYLTEEPRKEEGYFDIYPTHLSTHVQHMGSIAAAAAIRAELRNFKVEVPIYGDAITLPTLGRLLLPPSAEPEWRHGKVRIDHNGKITVYARDREFELSDFKTASAYWEPCKFFEIGEGPLKWRVLLDDQDPYGSFEKPRPEGQDASLSAADTDYWRTMLEEAWNILVTDHPQMAEEVARMRSIVPTKPWRQRFLQLSSSNPENGLSALLSLPENPLQLAIGLVHEYAHNKFNKLLRMFKLYKPDRPMENDRRLYSAWRSDPRPLAGHTHGTFASMCMGEFWRQRLHLGSEKERRLAAFEFAYWREVLPGALAQLQERADEYTALGQRFLNGMAGTIGSWQCESIPPDVDYLAQVTALSHAGQWRAYHLAPRFTDAGSMADTGLNVETEVKINKDVGYLGAIGLLARFKLEYPEEFETAYKQQTIQNVILDASLADAAFIAGDLSKARQLYLRQLAENPDDPASIVGLGLTETELNPGRTASMLLHFPHVVRMLSETVADSTEGSSIA